LGLVPSIPEAQHSARVKRFEWRISGEVVKDGERYTVTDYTLPQGLALSITELKPNKATRGHWHPTPECYVFFDACNLTLGKMERAVKAGEMVYIGPNEY